MGRLTKRAAMIAAVLGLVGCSGGGTAGTPPAASAAPVTLKLMDFSTEQTAFHKQVSDEYTRLYPNVTIQWVSIAQAQYEQTLPLAFQSKQAPDIFYWQKEGSNSMNWLMSNSWIGTVSPDGKVPSDWTKRWPAGSFQNGINMKNGKVYGFPWQDTQYWGPGYMYLNKAVFAQAGLDPNQAPTTWSQLADTCATIKSKTKAYCMAVPMKGTDWQRAWYAMAAGNMTDLLFDYKNGTFDLSDPRMLDTFNYLKGLYNKGYFAPGVQDKSFSRQQFAAGQAGIYMDGPWMVSVWDQLGFHSDGYVVAAHPNPDSGAAGALSSTNSTNDYWVSSQTQHAADAWKLIQWITNPTGFFVRNFLKNQFATLAFADSKKVLTDPAWQQIFKIGDTKGFRVSYPDPLLKCPALSTSSAYTDASALHPNWELQVMVDAITSNKDLKPAAQTVVSTRQQVLASELQKEAASGLNVSLSCYSFGTNGWDFTKSFNPASYPKS
ncbi:MAG TPA: extracellular solute-binding protein [Candidatus Dormibacteraeota bacterium]|nr:extracellular solute-binding protein [Candidatus Dormibacteraeota bacterium]